MVAPGAGRGGRRVVCGRCRRGRWVCAPGRVNRIAVRALPVRRARGADVSHRRPGALGRRWAAALSRPRRRAGQNPRISHRTRRSARNTGRAGRSRAGGGHRPRGPPRRQTPGRLHHRHRRPGRDPRQAGRAATGLHGPGRSGSCRGAATNGQWQTRQARPARARVPECRSLPRPGQRGRGDPGRHLRPGTRAGAGRGRRLVLRPRWGFAFRDAGNRRDQHNPRYPACGAHLVLRAVREKPKPAVGQT